MTSFWAPVNRIGKSVWLELFRRKDAYVLGIFMLLFLVGIRLFHVAGIENQATATMLLNLSLTLAGLCAHGLLIFQMARQVPDDTERKTLYVVLAHSVSRSQYLVAKSLYSVLAGLLVWVVLFTMGWIALVDSGAYSLPLLFQLVALQVISLAMLGAWVLWGSLVLPKALNICMAGAILLGSTQINRSVFQNENTHGLLSWFVAYLPDFSRLNLITRYTDGMQALPSSDFLSLLVYAALFIALPFFAAQVVFSRRSL